jgi:hypothetical protein
MATFEITIDDEKIQELLQGDRGMAALLEPVLNQILNPGRTPITQLPGLDLFNSYYLCQSGVESSNPGLTTREGDSLLYETRINVPS